MIKAGYRFIATGPTRAIKAHPTFSTLTPSRAVHSARANDRGARGTTLQACWVRVAPAGSRPSLVLRWERVVHTATLNPDAPSSDLPLAAS